MGKIKTVYVLFADLAEYSTKDIYKQKEYVKQFMGDLERELESCKKFVSKKKIIKSPAGDGIMIVIPTKNSLKRKKANALHKLPLKIARKLILQERDYELRIGLSYGEGLLYKDINKGKNYVGSTINNCSRIMTAADKNQILISDAYYNLLKEKGINLYERFQKYQIRVKHNQILDLYQYKSEE